MFPRTFFPPDAAPNGFLSETTKRDAQHLAKRTLDIIIALCFLFVALPFALIIAALIKAESPGPVIFRQRRHGVDGRVFIVYKFRTMRNDPAADGIQAQRGDARVTRVGNFLRRSSLDEMPQIVNVLLGDMSLVGPRPHPVWLNERFADEIAGFHRRHEVKPGITGLAQINGARGETPDVETMAHRVAFDLHYVENWSLLLDLKILGKTAFCAWFQRNAF